MDSNCNVARTSERKAHQSLLSGILSYEIPLGVGVRLRGSECRVQGSGFRVQGSGFRVQGSEFRVSQTPNPEP